MVTKVRGSVLADKNPYVVNDTSEIRSGSFPSVTFIKLKTRGNAEYQVDLTDTVSADDDFLVVHDGDGKRWKLVHNGTIDIRWANSTSGGVVDNASIVSALNTLGVPVVVNATYYSTTPPIFEIVGNGEVITDTSAYVTDTRKKQTKFSITHKAISETTLSTGAGTTGGYYTAWPFGCKFKYTVASVDYVAQVYTAGEGHTSGGGGAINNKVVLFRRAQLPDVAGDSITYGAATIIADKTASSLDCFTHGACRCANGDLITLVQSVNSSGTTTATQVYRSTNNGTSWSADNAQWLKSDGITPMGNPSEAGDLFVTSTGRILTWFRRGDNGESIVQYSDNNGLTWVDNVANTIGGTGRGVGEYETLEGKFTELLDGTIVAVVRQSADSVYTAREAAMFTVSTDNGVTWTTIAATNLTDMTENNAAIVYRDDVDLYEIYAGSRHQLLDGFGSLYQGFATAESLKRGIFFDVTRHKIPLYGSGATFTARDIGYPAAIYYNGATYLSYYGGQSVTNATTSDGFTAIVEKIGTSDEKTNTDLLNKLTGELHATYGANPYSNESEINLDKVGYARHSGVPIANFPSRMGSEYYLSTGNFVTVYEQSSRANITSNSNIGGANPYLIDVPTLMGNLYSKSVGGYIIEVTWAPNATGTTVSLDFGNGNTLVKMLKNYSSLFVRDSAILSVPCYRDRDANDGKLKMVVSQAILASNADFDYLRVKVIGIIPRN